MDTTTVTASLSATDWIGWTLVAMPLLLGGYAFVLYPALVWALARLRRPFAMPPEPTRDDDWPELSVLIVAYNEEKRLRKTLDHALATDYPAHKLNVLVVSDCSSDGTDDLVLNYGDPRVRLFRMPERSGKPAGENAAGPHLKGDIVVSIDASILIPRDSLKPLVRALLDPSVGLASGRDISIGDEAREGNKAESSYVGMEMTLRSWETQVHSIVGASGCFYANRRHLQMVQLPPELARDFAAASVARAHGYRAVSVDAATCLVPRTPTLKAELRRKSRTMGRGLATLLYLRDMMNPFKYGSYAWMMFSHKLVRWMLFPSLLGWVFGPLFLLQSAPYTLVLTLGMLVGLALARLVIVWPENKRLPKLVAFPGYIFISIVAGWRAWLHLLRNEKAAVWEPTQRPVSDMPSAG
ncbi:glycosyltransferase [Gemmatimonas sp. UBA7669]|uniref:glycosyltransferase n=1 Tax=Gemmatimonas sp. UBA7669 TaxID=1946568 RepID=UPI0025C01B9B|nr:glycosyltransferase [Gemmatimonas sp. UBA7669]